MSVHLAANDEAMGYVDQPVQSCTHSVLVPATPHRATESVRHLGKYLFSLLIIGLS